MRRLPAHSSGHPRRLPRLRHQPGITRPPPRRPGTICRDCAGISRHFTCLRCDYEGNLGSGRLCHPCARTQAITGIFGDTRHLSPALRSLAGALAAAPNAAATARWLATPHIRGLLADLITGRLPLTHQALAGRPGQSAIYLRDLLLSCGALPATDRQLAGYEGWVHRRLTDLAGHPHERLLRQFSLWHQLPRMGTWAAAGPLRPSAHRASNGPPRNVIV